MDPDIDLAFTHGPPEGILDDFGTRTSLRGCADLLQAVAASRPRLHCFGHNHSGWGATLVNWDGVTGDEPLLKGGLAQGCDPTFELTKATKVELKKRQDLASLKQEDAQSSNPTGCYYTKHCAEDPLPIVKGSTTLFVNAAYEGIESNSEGDKETQMPVIVDIDLPLRPGSGAKSDGVPAPMKRTPPMQRTLVSGQRERWVPPHKRQISTDQVSLAPQATRVLPASNARPVTPTQRSPHKTKGPAARSFSDGSGTLEPMRPVSMEADQGQSLSTTPLGGLASSHRSFRPRERSTSFWGWTNAERHMHHPIGWRHTPLSISGQESRLPSLSTASSSISPTQLPIRAARENQASPSQSNCAATEPRPEEDVDGQPSAQSPRLPSWRDRIAGAKGKTRNGGGSGTSKKKDHRGRYGFHDGKSKDRGWN